MKVEPPHPALSPAKPGERGRNEISPLQGRETRISHPETSAAMRLPISRAMPIALRGHVGADMPTQSRGHCTRLVFLLLCVSVLTGCNRGPQFGEVTGVVTLNGRPLSDLEVVFMPDPGAGTSGPTSSAYTNEKGQYHLVTA